VRRLLPPLVLGSALLAACADDATRTPTGLTPSTIAANASDNANANATDVEKMDPQDLPRNAHVFFARGQAGRPGGSSPNLSWHGGPVMHAAAIRPIYWGTSWDTDDGRYKIAGMKDFYVGYGGSGYAGTNGEYYDGSGTVVTGAGAISYGTELVDLSATPRRIPSTSEVLNEVCTALSRGGVAPSANGYYPVYVDIPRGHAQYCAWHSHGPCGGTDVQFGLVLKLDGDAGCDPGDDTSTHTQGLEAIANVSGHELSEAVTDPDLNAWYDSSGAENSDKCAWSFSGQRVTLGGSSWKIQGNWSNAAYDAQSGFANSSGQKGCIDGNKL
jgi:hypothetical protein